MLKKSALALIKIYQKTISPDHGFFAKLYPYGYCKFFPSCSEYSYQAIERYGVFKGIHLGISRIFRCNPWNKGGADPVE